MTFHVMFVHIIFSSVYVAEWPPFGKVLFTRLTICSQCILTICKRWSISIGVSLHDSGTKH